jgi:hypothetical protein
MPEVSSDSVQPPSPTRGRRLWKWFVAGFLLAFLGLAIVYPVTFYDGRAMYEVRLWRYYLLELQQQSRSGGTLGPTSGGLGAMLTVLAQHVLVAAVIGALAALVGRLSRPRVPRD